LRPGGQPDQEKSGNGLVNPVLSRGAEMRSVAGLIHTHHHPLTFMKRSTITLSATLAAVLLTFTACSKTPAPATTAGAKSGIESVDQKVSYGIGYNIGTGLARDGVVQVDIEAIKAGLADGLAKEKTRVPEADLQAAFQSMQERAAKVAAAEGEKQLTAGNDYLAKNKAKKGVKVTASGLQYEVLKSGLGAKPKATDTVRVNYHGTLIDGTVFDSSVERNEPVEFPVTGVIKGWVEALQLMSVGDKWKLTVPPSLGYGARNNGKIPANAVLIFEVELLGIK
jgi:FKBP-type peptidyl-prolyl cis-trans isomerase FklB